MKSSFVKYIDNYFEKLIKEYNFKKLSEIDVGQTYSIEYSSNIFVVKLEKYRQEFYVTLYKLGHHTDEINLFNLLDYLHKGTGIVPKANYFHKERDINESYRRQLKYLSNVVYDNYSEISDFFSKGRYNLKVQDIKRFMIEKYPDLFQKM